MTRVNSSDFILKQRATPFTINRMEITGCIISPFPSASRSGDMPHNATEIGIGRFQQQKIVIADQAEGMDDTLETLMRLF